MFKLPAEHPNLVFGNTQYPWEELELKEKGEKMTHRLLLSFFIAAACLLGAGEEKERPRLITMSYELVKLPGLAGNYKAYTFHVPRLEGLSEEGKVAFITKSPDGRFTDFMLFLENDGRLTTMQNNRKVPFVFLAGNFGYGESLELLVAPINDNPYARQEAAICTIIPNPLEVVDEQGHKISLMVIDPDGQMFDIKLSNFAPFETINITSRSGKEVISSPLNVDKEGNAVFGSAPAVKGKKQGTFEIIASTKNMKPLIMRHVWGKVVFPSEKDAKRVPMEYKP